MKNTKQFRRLLFVSKEYIVDKKYKKDGYSIRDCDSNVSKMNIVECMIFKLTGGRYYGMLNASIIESFRDLWKGLLAFIMILFALVSYVIPIPLLTGSVYRVVKARKNAKKE